MASNRNTICSVTFVWGENGVFALSGRAHQETVVLACRVD